MILFLGGLHAAIGEDCCDPSMIGDTNVAGRLTNGKLAGDRWMVVSNTLVCIHTEVAPLQDPAGSADSDPSLKLMFHPSDAPDASGVKGFHGRLYLNNDQPTPVLAQTNLVDIDSAADGSRIVMMVLPNGPVFSSTNSGMTWAMINTPGRYEIPLSGGFSAAATINPVSEDLLAAHFQTNHWYAIGSARDSEQLVAVSNPYEATPVMSIIHANGGVLVAWPAAFNGYGLQANSDLATTNWMDVSAPITVVGQTNQVFIPSPAGNQFYRLKSLNN